MVLGFNGLAYVDDCLGALGDQRDGTPTYEIIFFDNASIDGTPERVERRHPSVRLVRSPVNLGYAAGNVAALDHATARWVLFLNQDTVVSRGFIRAMVEAAESTGAAAIHGNMVLPWQACAEGFDRAAEHPDVHIAELTRAAFVGYAVAPGPRIVPTLFVSGAAFMIDRDVLPAIGGLFDQDFWAYCEDTDLALRLRAAGRGVVIAQDAVFLHDLTPEAWLDRRAVAKTVRILRNRHLACLRSMHASEYLRALPDLLFRSGGKADHIPTTGLVSLLVRPGMVVLSFVAMAWVCVSLPRHRAARARTLRSRVGGRLAILAALRSADADLDAWQHQRS